MKVIASDSFSYGFALSEGDLLRIIDSFKEQIAKLPNQVEISEEHEVVFKNGSIADHLTIQEILAGENHGGEMIKTLKIKISSKDKKENQDDAKKDKEDEDINKNIIQLMFNNPEMGISLSYDPISYFIQGTSRDWVFICKSLVEEKIEKVKRKTYYIDKLRDFWWLLIFPFLIFIGPVYDFIIPEKPKIEEFEKAKPNPDYSIIKDIESIKDSTFKSPVDAVISIEYIKQAKKEKNDKIVKNWEEERDKWFEDKVNERKKNIFVSLPFPFDLILVFALPISIMFLLYWVGKKYYPMYNFIWGDYKEVFEKKKTLANNIFWGVIIAFVLGIIVNLLTNK